MIPFSLSSSSEIPIMHALYYSISLLYWVFFFLNWLFVSMHIGKKATVGGGLPLPLCTPTRCGLVHPQLWVHPIPAPSQLFPHSQPQSSLGLISKPTSWHPARPCARGPVSQAQGSSTARPCSPPCTLAAAGWRPHSPPRWRGSSQGAGIFAFAELPPGAQVPS